MVEDGQNGRRPFEEHVLQLHGHLTVRRHERATRRATIPAATAALRRPSRIAALVLALALFVPYTHRHDRVLRIVMDVVVEEDVVDLIGVVGRKPRRLA